MMEAIKLLLPRQKRQELIKQTRYRIIEIDPVSGTPIKTDEVEDSFFESSAESAGENYRMERSDEMRLETKEFENIQQPIGILHKTSSMPRLLVNQSLSLKKLQNNTAIVPKKKAANRAKLMREALTKRQTEQTEGISIRGSQEIYFDRNIRVSQEM